MKIAISGCRYFATAAGSWQWQYIADKLAATWSSHPGAKMLVGDAYGADQAALYWAEHNNVKAMVFHAEWDRLGRAAGPIRNARMIDNADMLVAFWDGKSRGTKNAIDNAHKKGIPVVIFSDWNPERTWQGA